MPSRRAALAWMAWLLLAGIAWLLAPVFVWPLRAALAALTVGVGWLEIRRFVLLRGKRALRALEWNPAGELFVRVGPEGIRWPAVSEGHCRRYGPGLWILRLRTARGPVSALLEARLHDPVLLRRWWRQDQARHRRAPGGQSGQPPSEG